MIIDEQKIIQFALQYFGGYITKDITDFHVKLTSGLENAVNNEELFHIEGNRGEGKTFWSTFIFPMWAAVTKGKSVFIKSFDRYFDKLIINDIHDTLINSWFSKMVKVKTSNSIVLTNGAVIGAYNEKIEHNTINKPIIVNDNYSVCVRVC